MGIFADYQPRYAAVGIATFPLLISGKDKKPLTKGYQRVGHKGSAELAAKFPDTDALGFCAGKRSGISVLDVDSADERVLADAMARHGRSPFVVRTASGHFHVWYRFCGEKRLIRPNPNEPIDILGDGIVVLPPSIGGTRPYEIIEGVLDDIADLPSMAGQPVTPSGPMRNSSSSARIGSGARERALFHHLMLQVPFCDTPDDLIDVAFTFAESRLDRADGHPFTDAEIHAKVAHVWNLQQTGRNLIGGAPRTTIPPEAVDVLMQDPDANHLHTVLRRLHSDRTEFFVANAMAGSVGLSIRRLRAARERLVATGLIICTRKGGRGPKDPARYRWP